MRLRLMLWSLLALVLCGCADLTHIHELRDRATRARESMLEREIQLEALREQYPDQSPEAIEIDASLAQTRALIEALTAATRRIDQTLDEAQRPTDGLTHAARGLGAFLPEPLRLPLLLGAALGATLIRSGQLKKGAISIARSIEKAKQTDGALREAIARNAGTLRTIQTPTARRLVDLAQSGNPRVSLPI
ncbi:MAG: hypothetical protein ACIARR_09300 [Phycisphaerales bacterium JB059]